MTYGMDFLKKWTDNVRNEYDGKWQNWDIYVKWKYYHFIIK